LAPELFFINPNTVSIFLSFDDPFGTGVYSPALIPLNLVKIKRVIIT
jgi:hypothetical protein